MKVRILTDSSTGIPQSEATAKDIELAHMPIMFGDSEFIDGVTISLAEFYRKMTADGVMPKTALINKQQFIEIFSTVKARHEAMVVFPISKYLSATYENALQAKASVGYEHIYVVDTKQTTTALSALVYEAVKMRDAGQSAAAIFAACSTLTDKIKICAVVKTLKYLQAGGRLSKASAVIGTMLNIKPIISVINGKVENIHKCMGQKAAYAFLLNRFHKENPDPNMPIYFCHTNDLAECNDFKKLFANEPFTVGGTYDIGSTVASHTGPGLVGVAYFAR